MNQLDVFSGVPVSLEEMLICREKRVALQQKMICDTECFSLISFTLNIPGDIKQSAALNAVFEEGAAQLRTIFGGYILDERINRANTGSELFLALKLDSYIAKERTLCVENTHFLGRLFDIDVLDYECKAVSRDKLSQPHRRCLLCGEDAKTCSRNHSHAVKLLREHITNMVNAFFREKFADRFMIYAVRALLYEVSITPKPGLVDRSNSGAHSDMDFFTFLDSSTALMPWLQKTFQLGWDYAQQDTHMLFTALRYVGLQAEKEMYAATNGVNTHKGAIFSFAILGGALGKAYASSWNPPAMKNVLLTASEIANCSLHDFDTHSETHGVRCFLTHGIDGIRGEASRGFPAAVQVGLPALRTAIERGLSINDAAVHTLLSLIGCVQDTNMIHRGGIAAACACMSEAKKMASSYYSSMQMSDTLKKLDEKYIAENLSPGGCADILSITLMLWFLLENGFLTDE